MLLFFLTHATAIFRPVPYDHELVKIAIKHINNLFSLKLGITATIEKAEYEINDGFRVRLTFCNFGKFTMVVTPHKDVDVDLIKIEPIEKYSSPNQIPPNTWTLLDPNNITENEKFNYMDYISFKYPSITFSSLGTILGVAKKITNPDNNYCTTILFFAPYKNAKNIVLIFKRNDDRNPNSYLFDFYSSSRVSNM